MLNAWHLPVAPFVKQNKDNVVITLWLAPLTLGVAVVALVALIRHPLMPVYGEILLKVVSR